MDDQSRLILAGNNFGNDAVKRHNGRFDLRCEQLQRQICRRHGSGYGNLHGLEFFQSNHARRDHHGTILISPRMVGLEELKTMKVAVPGTMTTAYLALKLFAPKIETAVVPFDRIIPEVVAGKYEAGLIIHEGQLTYERSGLKRILDLGKWWHGLTGLPL